ncbi:MAG: MFS transporter [Solobacterium sp.]|nr:MFS transporter [Solobacterium sp.]
MDVIDKKTFFGFAFLDFLFWAYFAAFIGYISTYMLACGMKSSVLSIVLAVYMACCFAGAFFWGGQCDKRRTNKKVFLFEFTTAVILALIVYFMADKNIWVSAVIYPVFGFFAAPLGSNLDSWMLRSFDRSASVYGRARAIGSLGYAVVMLVCGQLINRIGYIVIPISSIIVACGVITLAVFMKEKEYSAVQASAEKVRTADLLKIRPYIFMIAVVFLTGLAAAPINNLKIIILQSVGGDVSLLGVDAFIGVCVQAVFLFISGSLRRIPRYFRLLLSTTCCLAMLALTNFAVAPFMIIIGTVANNVSYGILIPTMREITESSVTGALKNRAHSLSDAMFGSFAGVIALTYSGFLMDTFGPRSAAFLGMCIMAVPIAMTLFAMLKPAKKA